MRIHPLLPPCAAPHTNSNPRSSCPEAMRAISTALAKESDSPAFLDTDSFVSGSGRINFEAFDQYIRRHYFISFQLSFFGHYFFSTLFHISPSFFTLQWLSSTLDQYLTSPLCPKPFDLQISRMIHLNLSSGPPLTIHVWQVAAGPYH